MTRRTKLLLATSVLLFIGGIVQSRLLTADVGGGLRWSIGIVLTVMFLTSAVGFFLSRRSDERLPRLCRWATAADHT